ncbi:MAG: hypothetical protein J6A58_10250, partial [Oscillospiraceae bacterium]|nr:hypothetical protein [Oscillospiraceae bacterium]
MMKRGISLVTALILSSSLSLAPFTNVAGTEIVSVKAAGSADFALNDQIVSLGVKKVTVPVIFNAAGMGALDASISVKADGNGANPVITNITNGIYDGVMANSVYEDGSERKFVWVDGSGQGKDFANQPVAYVEIEIPTDAVIGSTYTVKLYDLDPADANQEDVTPAAASYEATITIGDNVVDGYKTFMDDAEGYAGTVVNIPVMIQCPEMIDAIVADFTIDGGAKIVGYTKDDSDFDAANFMDSVSNENKVLWATPDNKGINVSELSNFITLQVQIPADAKTGTVYNVSLDNTLDTSTVDGVDITPSKFAAAKVTVIEKGVKGDLTAEIGSKSVKLDEAVVKLPVMVSHDMDFAGFAAFVSKFEATNGAEVVSVSAGSSVNAEDVMASNNGNKGVWNSANSDDVSFAVNADGTRDEIFVIEVKLPADRAIGDEYDVVFVEGSVDIGTHALEDLVAKQINGKITIVKEDDKLDAYTITMEDKELEATGGDMTVKIPVYLDGAEINTFAGTFDVSNGATIKSITSSLDGFSTGKENANRVVWQGADGQDTKFDAKTPFAIVEVVIPAELAVTGKSFAVSVSDVDSANANHADVYPSTPYDQGVISLTGVADTFDMVIDDATAEVATAEAVVVPVPVHVEAADFYALDGTFSVAPTALGATGGVLTVDFTGNGASANGTDAANMEIGDVKSGAVTVTTTLNGVESFTASIVDVKDATGKATVSLGKDNKGSVVWTLDEKTGADFALTDDFMIVYVEVKPVLAPTTTTTSVTSETSAPTETSVTSAPTETSVTSDTTVTSETTVTSDTTVTSETTVTSDTTVTSETTVTSDTTVTS